MGSSPTKHPKVLVAQLVEQMTLNHWVESSSLSGYTMYGAVAELVKAPD